MQIPTYEPLYHADKSQYETIDSVQTDIYRVLSSRNWSFIVGLNQFSFQNVI